MIVRKYCNTILLTCLVLISTIDSHKTSRLENYGAFCANDTARGDPNLIPIDDNPPVLVRTVENGSLYTIGSGEDQSWLVHVWGERGYDYGYAYGTLLKEQIQQLQPRAWAHFQQEIIDSLASLKLPKWFEEIIITKGLDFALDFQNTLAEPYIDKDIYEEMRGIADAADVDFRSIRRLHMLGEITRGFQSIVNDPLELDGFFLNSRSLFTLWSLGKCNCWWQDIAVTCLGLGYKRGPSRFSCGDNLSSSFIIIGTCFC